VEFDRAEAANLKLKTKDETHSQIEETKETIPEKHPSNRQKGKK